MLGLAALGGVVCRHGGAIQLESAPGVGTFFRVLFPAAGEAPAPGETDGPAAAGRVRAPHPPDVSVRRP